MTAPAPSGVVTFLFTDIGVYPSVGVRCGRDAGGASHTR
jgi:hypothetical protein